MVISDAVALLVHVKCMRLHWWNRSSRAVVVTCPSPRASYMRARFSLQSIHFTLFGPSLLHVRNKLMITPAPDPRSHRSLVVLDGVVAVLVFPTLTLYFRPFSFAFHGLSSFFCKDQRIETTGAAFSCACQPHIPVLSAS